MRLPQNGEHGVSILDRDAILQGIAALAARWPRAFSVHQAKRAPLKRGIDRDIAAAAPDTFAPDELKSALRFYVHCLVRYAPL